MRLQNALTRLRGPAKRRRRAAATRRLLSAFVAPGDLVFDVGANVGDMTREFLALGARVVAFEPQEQCRIILAKRFPQVVIDPRALSDRDGTTTLHVPTVSTLGSIAPDWIQAVKDSGRFSEFAWRGAQEVATGTLQSAIDDYGEPIFCKIDVEGSEEAVINGLDTPVRALSLEFVPEHRTGYIRAVERLAELGGYEWNYVKFQRDGGDSGRFEFARWMTSVEFAAYLQGYDGEAAGNMYGRQISSAR